MVKERASAQKDALFKQNLQTISSVLTRQGISYSLVGGLAIKAILKQPTPARRTNGTIYDFDAVAIGPNKDTIDSALAEIKQKSHQPVFPEIGIESAHFANLPPPLNQ